MKGLKGVVPAIAIIAALAAAGIGTPVALAEMQHRQMTKFTPGDLTYGVMRAGEAIMSVYRFNKQEWDQELISVREMERTELQRKCPQCTQQLQELEEEKLMLQERIRTRTEYGTGEGVQTHTQTETQTGGSGTSGQGQGGP